MDVHFLTLCDFAQNVNGKITMVGTFDLLRTTKVPVIHPTCSIASRLLFEKNEVGKHSFVISITDENKKDVIPPVEGGFEVKIPDDRKWGSANIVVSLGGLEFTSSGNHSVDLLIDNKLVKSIPFTVAIIPANDADKQ